MHSLGIVVGEDAENQLFAFSDYLEEPYQAFLSPEQIAEMADEYEVSPDNLEFLCRHLQEWADGEGFIENGQLGYWSIENPNGKFDWFDIGGRWGGYLQLASGELVDQALLKDLDIGLLLGNAPVFVIKDGEWLTGDMEPLEPANEAWITHYQAIINSLPPDSLITVVDIHH
jgi:hypothetical protein